MSIINISLLCELVFSLATIKIPKMALRVTVLASLLAVASCNPIAAPYGGYGQGVGYFAPAVGGAKYGASGYGGAHGPAPIAQPEQPAQYNFAYGVADPKTGDFKSQSEVADGKSVKGVYTLLEADGTKRIVEYADFGAGFTAIVKKEGVPAPAPVPAPASVPAPAPAPGPVAPVQAVASYPAGPSSHGTGFYGAGAYKVGAYGAGAYGAGVYGAGAYGAGVYGAAPYKFAPYGFAPYGAGLFSAGAGPYYSAGPVAYGASPIGYGVGFGVFGAHGAH